MAPRNPRPPQQGGPLYPRVRNYEPGGPEELDTRMPALDDDIARDVQEEKPKRLLESPDNQIGRKLLCFANVPEAVGDAGRGRETVICDLYGSSKFGQLVTVVFACYDPVGWGGPEGQKGSVLAAEPGLPVGIIRFGNGGGEAEVEVDIPNANSHSNGQSYAANGCALSVPAGRLRVSVRDDGRVRAHANQTAPVPDGTAGGQLVSAHVVYGDRGSPGRVYRSLIFAHRFMEPADPVTLRIPAFARSVKFVRSPREELTISMRMGWSSGGGPFVLDSFTVPATEDSPVYPVPPRATQIVVGTNSQLSNGMAVFEIAL